MSDGSFTWAGIVRVSHMGARKANAPDFHSEREQVQAMEQAVARLGGQLEVLPSELDVSGGLPLERRPSLLQAVEGVEAGRYGGVIVAYQSRLGRDTEYEEAVWRRVERAGGRIEMALDGLDTTTVDGRMVRRIRSAMNAAERERHVERFDDLRRWATAAGIWQRRQTPLGYQRDPATRRLVPDENAVLVAEAFRRRAAGDDVTSIARLLGMTQSGARQLLRNRVYLGELRVGEYVNREAHPAIVTLEQFEAAQVPRARPARATSGFDGPALLAGLVRCQGCGHILSRANAKAVVYQHPAGSSARGCPAPTAITLALLDAFVERIAVHELEQLAATVREAGTRVEDAQARLAAAELELGAYLEAVSAADVGADAFARASRARREAVDAARHELAAALALRPGLPAYGEASAIWQGLDAHERNALLRGLLEMVIVRRAGGRGARAAVTDRVRVIRHGAGLVPFGRGGAARNGAGVHPLPWPDLDDDRVLRVPGGEDRL